MRQLAQERVDGANGSEFIGKIPLKGPRCTVKSYPLRTVAAPQRQVHIESEPRIHKVVPKLAVF